MSRKIIVAGGGFSNKGAEAMLFVCMDEIKKRWPNHEIVLLSQNEYAKKEEIESKYYLKVKSAFPLEGAFYKENGISKVFAKLKGWNKDKQKQIDDFWNSVDLVLDISGYALGSNWNYDFSIVYLLPFAYAKVYRIPIYAMPQSYGPFNYKGKKGLFIEYLIRKYLTKASILFAREEKGKRCLEKIGARNVRLASDIVLCNKSIDPHNIYTSCDDNTEKQIIEAKSVAIIPNVQNNKHTEYQKLLDLYRNIVNELIKSGFHVYVVRHDRSDATVCRNIADMFKTEKQVTLIDKDLDCLGMSELLSKFEFAIASRFHSIVHAYKVGTPCLAIGWAEKYYNLLAMFEQSNYMIDARENVENESVIQKLLDMTQKYAIEEKIIQSKLKDVQKENVFESIIIKP